MQKCDEHSQMKLILFNGNQSKDANKWKEFWLLIVWGNTMLGQIDDGGSWNLLIMLIFSFLFRKYHWIQFKPVFKNGTLFHCFNWLGRKVSFKFPLNIFDWLK